MLVGALPLYGLENIIDETEAWVDQLVSYDRSENNVSSRHEVLSEEAIENNHRVNSDDIVCIIGDDTDVQEAHEAIAGSKRLYRESVSLQEVPAEKNYRLLRKSPTGDTKGYTHKYGKNKKSLRIRKRYTDEPYPKDQKAEKHTFGNYRCTVEGCIYESFTYKKDFVLHNLLVHPKKIKNISSLMWAAEHNHWLIMQKLLEAGIESNTLDAQGNTALIKAVRYGSTQTVRVLLLHGAQKMIANQQGETPLLLAVALGHTDIVALLLKD